MGAHRQGVSQGFERVAAGEHAQHLGFAPGQVEQSGQRVRGSGGGLRFDDLEVEAAAFTDKPGESG